MGWCSLLNTNAAWLCRAAWTAAIWSQVWRLGVCMAPYGAGRSGLHLKLRVSETWRDQGGASITVNPSRSPVLLH